MSVQSGKINLVKFAPKTVEGFYDTLKQKVESYLAEHKLQANGNHKMIGKTICMISLYVIPFVLLLSMGTANLFVFYGMWVLMGVGMVGIGCAVMHDSNHGTYSDNKTLNKLMGKIIALVGGYEVNWRIQHNILHHTYTNIEGLDHDLDAGIFLRFSPHSKRYMLHRFQHIYAWVLYGVLTLKWATVKDFQQAIQYEKFGLLRKEKISLKKALFRITLYKLIYYSYIIILPVVILGIPFLHVLLGFLLMHFVGGFLLSVVFQLAHVMETSEFPEPNEDRKIENNWAIHQMLNTTNFSPKSDWMNWFVGGLNHQIEHHLFPHISHVHYRRIAPIVKSMALEFGLPYNVQPTFIYAVWQHGKMLRKLGRG